MSRCGFCATTQKYEPGTVAVVPAVGIIGMRSNFLSGAKPLVSTQACLMRKLDYVARTVKRGRHVGNNERCYVSMNVGRGGLATMNIP